jgi:uncharacterized protein YuzE
MAEPIEDWVLTRHAEEEMAGRGIDLAAVAAVLAAPEQRLSVRPGRDVLHGRKVLERTTVKAKYDRETDTLKLILREGVAVSESDEDKPGVILDYDQEGNLVSIEVLDASKRVDAANKIELEMTG